MKEQDDAARILELEAKAEEPPPYYFIEQSRFDEGFDFGEGESGALVIPVDMPKGITEYATEAANRAPNLARELVEARKLLIRCRDIFQFEGMETFEHMITSHLMYYEAEKKGSSNG
jgi:hypothetical protein